MWLEPLGRGRAAGLNAPLPPPPEAQTRHPRGADQRGFPARPRGRLHTAGPGLWGPQRCCPSGGTARPATRRGTGLRGTLGSPGQRSCCPMSPSLPGTRGAQAGLSQSSRLAGAAGPDRLAVTAGRDHWELGCSRPRPSRPRMVRSPRSDPEGWKPCIREGWPAGQPRGRDPHSWRKPWGTGGLRARHGPPLPTSPRAEVLLQGF